MTRNILVFVPMHRCAPQIGRVVAQFNDDLQARFAEILFVDNRSPDSTVDAAIKAADLRLKGVHWRVVRNRANCGLGGSHKVAFFDALDKGRDGVAVLHGDDQGSIRDLIGPLDAAKAETQCLLGARFMKGARLDGYSAFRTFGNHAFNAIFSLTARRRIHDLGAGLNFYRRSFLEDLAFLRCADDLTFNNDLLLQAFAKRAPIEFFPITWREDDQISNVKLVRQAMKTLVRAAEYASWPQAFLARSRAGRGPDMYLYETIAEGGAPAR